MLGYIRSYMVTMVTTDDITAGGEKYDTQSSSQWSAPCHKEAQM